MPKLADQVSLFAFWFVTLQWFFFILTDVKDKRMKLQ
jgi:hypothetical protein